jgi:adenylate cyclase
VTGPIRLWQRFDVRTTAWFAVPVYLVLTLMAAMNYQRGVEAELRALQGRLHSVVVALSMTLDPTIASPEISAKQLIRTRHLFEEVASDEPDLASIYVLHRTDQPKILKFTVDWVREGTPGAPGEEYDATSVPVMLEAFDKGPVVETDFFPDKWGVTFSGYAPIHDASGAVVGIVGADITMDRVMAMKRRVMWSSLAMFGAAGVVLVLAGFVAGRALGSPVQRMLEVTGAIRDGRLDVRANLLRGDEFGLLGQHFDAMAAGLEERQHIRQVFGRYVSERVARRVLANPEAARLGGDERVLTALFADIRGYSTISEQLAPTEVVDLLNRYMGAMCEVVDEHGGCVIDFFGDGLLVVFGAPDRLDDDPERAVRCALAMKARLAELNAEWERTGLAERWKSAGLDTLGARIGVHTGRAVAGNMGGPNRVRYMVTGEAVHVAQKVEALNKALGTALLVTRGVYDRLPDELKSQAQPRGAHALPDRPEPVEVFALS